MATSEERNRIAREMHDGVAQEIVAPGLHGRRDRVRLDEPETRALARRCARRSPASSPRLRFSIFDLRHQVTDTDCPARGRLRPRGQPRRPDLRVHLSLDESGTTAPARTETELLRVAQEAIGNVRKHARADNLWVTLDSDGSSLRLEVADDGVGNAGPEDRHWGLQTMQERAATIGADLAVTPRQGGGTVVRLGPATTAPSEGRPRP